MYFISYKKNLLLFTIINFIFYIMKSIAQTKI